MADGMVVLVCGGRTFSDYAALKRMLDAIHTTMGGITKIVSGAARGADSLGEYWAHENHVTLARYPADWTTHGKAAGFIRNQQMIDTEPVELIVACPGGRGTADMVRRAKARGISVMTVEVPG